MEFFESVDEFPELCETMVVVMVDVDCKQLVARVRQDHVEELGRRLLDVNGRPEGGIAESSASPLGTDVSEREQRLDAICSEGKLKDLAEDFRWPDRFGVATVEATTLVSKSSLR